MSRRRRTTEPTFAEAWGDLRADYELAKNSRFHRARRGVSGVGRSADYHFKSDTEYLRMMEIARDIGGRNDSVVGQVIDRAVANTVQGGLWPDPATGDAGLDRDLKARYQAYAEDPDQVDLAGEHDLAALQSLVLRQTLVDGDVVLLPTREGPLQVVEGHRLRTPANTNRQVVLGILLDQYRRRVEYWITREDVGLRGAVTRVSEVRQYLTRHPETGERQVFHVYNPKRVSQTRGVTALAPIGHLTQYFDDILFARLVQQQVVSCFAILHKRPAGALMPGPDVQRGERTTETLADGSTRTIEGYAPGMEVFGEDGEDLQGFSPNVPNPEFFPFARLILTLIGVNLGMPLVLLLMDASETNFSGWRGALEQAKMQFRANQRWLVARFLRPDYLRNVRRWIADDEGIRRAAGRSGIDPFAHRWNLPGWPYIQPREEAAADLLRTRNGLTSHRRWSRDRMGCDWADELAPEIVEDNAALIAAAHEKALAMREQYPDLQVTWRDLAGLPLAEGFSMSLQDDRRENDDASPPRR